MLNTIVSNVLSTVKRYRRILVSTLKGPYSLVGDIKLTGDTTKVGQIEFWSKALNLALII